MAENTDKTSTAQKWAQRLRGRTRMAVAAVGAVFAVGLFFVSRPLGERIDFAEERLARAEARMSLAGEIGELRRQSALFNKKLPHGVDVNDWTNYLLTGIRAQRVRLSRMDPKDQLTLGPCKVLSWQIEMEGDFDSLSKVVEWLENGERLVRIDRLVMQNANGNLTMSMIAKGLALDVPLEKLKLEREKQELQAAKAARSTTPRTEQIKSEKAPSWIDEKPLVVPEGMKLPSGVRIPDAVRQAISEGGP